MTRSELHQLKQTNTGMLLLYLCFLYTGTLKSECNIMLILFCSGESVSLDSQPLDLAVGKDGLAVIICLEKKVFIHLRDKRAALRMMYSLL